MFPDPCAGALKHRENKHLDLGFVFGRILIRPILFDIYAHIHHSQKSTTLSGLIITAFIYRRVLIGLIFGQKQIHDWYVYFYSVSGRRRRDPEMWWKLMASSTQVFVKMSPCCSPHKFPSRFRISAPESCYTIKENISILNVFLAEYSSDQYCSVYMLIYTTHWKDHFV